MATLAFFAAGYAIGGSMSLVGVGIFAGVTSAMVGGAIGGTVGGVIDQQFVMPALFGAANQTGPRLEELDIQTASEGSTIKRVYGPNCRVAGTIVWMPKLKEEEQSSGGGKGGFGGGGGGTQFTYYADMLVLVCRAGNGGAVSRIKKVWADSRLIYDGGGPAPTTATSTQLALLKINSPGGLASSLRRVRITSPLAGPNLQLFTVGQDVSVSGFTNAGNNATYRVIRTLNYGASGTGLELQWRSASVTEAAGANVTITQLPDREDSLYEALTTYLGTLSQTADPTYEAAKGSGNAAAFRSWCCVAIKGLTVGEFGNRIPQLHFLVEEAATRTVGETIAFILQDAGLTVADYDVSACTALIEGYVVDGPTSAAAALEPLMLAYDIALRESNGKLVFFPRSSAPTVPVQASDLAAHEEDADYYRPIVLQDRPRYELPSEVNVNYIDPEMNYSKGSAAFRKTTFLRDNVITVDVPVVLTAQQARDIAKRLLMTAWAENRKATLSLPPSYMTVEEGDLLGPITVSGQAYTIRVDDVTRGINFRSEIMGSVTQTQTATQTTGSMGSGAGTNTPPYYPPVMAPLVLNIPALTEAHTLVPGVYYGTFSIDRAAQFTSAQMFWSTDDLNFTLVGDMNLETPGGECATVLGNATPGYWDYLNTVDVNLSHGDLENKSEAQVLAGQNVALVGQEIIGFQTATLLAPGSYRLSNLLRGLRNTERFISTHVTDESFVMLSSATLQLHTLNLSTISTVRNWRSVASLGLVADAASLAPPLTAATVQSFSPCQVTLSRDGSNNLTVTWQRRSRSIFRHFGSAPAPLLEEDERYDIAFRVGATTVVKQVVAARTYTYTAAQQTIDGLTPSDTKNVTLYQVSLSVGRGFPTQEFSV